MQADQRRAALASLFIVERSGNLYALRVRDQATGGWALRPDERLECPVSMLEARMLSLRDGLVDAVISALDSAAPSRAAEQDEPEPGAVLSGIVRAEEHERAALVRELDEARAGEAIMQRIAQGLRDDVERLLGELNAALGEIATLKAELASRPAARGAQLALFASPAADPAGEAQRAAVSGAAVGAPAPKPAKVPAPVCAPCGGVPLVPAADMPREGEATGGKPLGCPACGEGYDGTPEQIARAQADSDAATRRLAKADGKCWRCGNAIHRGRCKGAR